MRVTELAGQIKAFVLGWIDSVLSTGGRDLGSPSKPFGTIYADGVTADVLLGTLSGNEWQHGGDMIIDANSADDTVLSVVNQGPGVADFFVQRNIALGGTVDGVDVAAHAANANAHHAQQHGLDGSDHTGTLSWSKVSKSGSNLADLATRAHSSLTGIGANDHHNQGHVLATNAGLGADHTISGATAGHVLRASSATAAAFAAIQDGDLPSTIVRTSRQIVSGNGLTGGGNLSADRTLAVGAGAGITVNGDDVALTTPGSLTATSTNSASGNHTHAIDSTIARSAITISAGNGLSGGGDLTANRTIALSTPGSLSATSTNSSSGSHTHVIDSTIARSAITISAGNGLSGGGDLTANRTLAVNQDYDFNWTGLHTFGEHTEMESVDVNGALTVFDDLSVFHGGYYPLYVNVDTLNPNNSNVGIMTNTPDPQFALDVAGPLRAQYLIGPHAIQLSDAAMIAHYDGPYPFETNFDGFAAGHLGQVATTTGGVIYRPGKFGKAVQTAEATTNLVTNPRMQTLWSAYGTPTTRELSTAWSRVGANSLRLVGDSGGDGAALFAGSLTSGTTYTLSADVKRVSGSPRIAVVRSTSPFTSYGGATWSGAAERRLSVTFTMPSTETCNILLFCDSGEAYFDAVQLEQKAYATPYCDGSLGAGHAWSGTAHASTSSRTATTISYSDVGVDPDGITWMAWIYPTSSSSYQVIASQTNGGFSEGWELANSSGTARIQLRNPSVTIINGALTLNTWNHIAATYDRTTLRLYLNGVETANTAATQSVATTNALALGYRPGGSTFNGLIDEFVLLDRAAPADEIRSIYESDAPVFAESSIEVWRTPTQVPIWVDSEGLWMRAVGGGETLGAYGGAATKSWGGKTLYQSDFLLGNATNGYIHWHAFQNPADPYGAAGMEVKAQVDISGNSKISGNLAVQNGAGTVTYLQVTSQAMYVGGNINSSRALSAFFADDVDLPGAAPGGPQFDTGDLIIGEPTANHLLWDQSAGRFNFRDGTTLNSYIDDDGITMLYGAAGGHLRTMSDSTLIFDLFSETESSQANTYLNFFPISDSPGGNLVIVAHNAAGVEQGRVQFQDDGGVNFTGPSGTVVINKYTSINGRLDLSTGTGPLTGGMILHKLTTTQQNALTGVTNGMIIYNTTTNKFRGYAAGAWTDLH